ncbi:unnamed protein product [Arabis nemorensis]|uniref:Uncharacterized protein n=1 Tax=Arabis nemorensis TaxID=586526 RepID=A0A565CXK8_9BRAS|nr:unnamed protein product [Arabis nemorensis]
MTPAVSIPPSESPIRRADLRRNGINRFDPIEKTTIERRSISRRREITNLIACLTVCKFPPPLLRSRTVTRSIQGLCALIASEINYGDGEAFNFITTTCVSLLLPVLFQLQFNLQITGDLRNRIRIGEKTRKFVSFVVVFVRFRYKHGLNIPNPKYPNILLSRLGRFISQVRDLLLSYPFLAPDFNLVIFSSSICDLFLL